MTLVEVVRLLQEFGILAIIVLLVYVVYRMGMLLDVMSKKLKREE